MLVLFSSVFVYAETRVWTMEDGRTFDAEFVNAAVGKVFLKNKKGEKLSFKVKEFSKADQEVIQLETPPSFDISFSKTSDQRRYLPDLFQGVPPQSFRYVFGVKVNQTSSARYNHELKVEFFAIGTEVHGKNYILLDRQEKTFVPTEENDQSLEFTGKTIELIKFLMKMGNDNKGTRREDSRGRKYSSFLVVITDSRGKIIAYKTPKKFLFENLENLKEVPLGKYFDKTCTRVGPTRPITLSY